MALIFVFNNTVFDRAMQPNGGSVELKGYSLELDCRGLRSDVGVR